FYINTFGLVFLNYTELFFTFLILLSIDLFTQNKKLLFYLCGVSIAATVAVRPVGWALLSAIILVDVIISIQNKKINFRIIYLFSGLITFILFFGMFNKLHFNKFIFTSSTGPVNLLLGANETATGAFDSEVFEIGNRGFIANPDTINYLETGDYYFNQAIDWITKNPVKWISLMPMKVLHTFATDDIAVASLLQTEEWNFVRTIKSILIKKDLQSILKGKSTSTKVFYYLIQCITHIYYYLFFIILVLGLFKIRKEIRINFPYLLPILFVLIGILMIMVTVGTPRYKYPFVIVMIPFAASYLYNLLSSKVNKS
ncbi:MAG: hypothetical protein R3321_05970, partial [Nitrososphaeraceae archaeon]|nr:hypothetical protein [Nitrososphaeraceae archaeon]